MADQDWLAERFEENRSHLRGVAYPDARLRRGGRRRCPGGLDPAEPDRHQPGREPAGMVDDRRRSRLSEHAPVADDAARSVAGDPPPGAGLELRGGIDPEQEALLGDSVGLAMLVVLDSLTPAERVAFVLHDVFAVPFDEIAPIVGRTPAAARQLASRARRRVQGAPVPDVDLDGQWVVVEAFLAAARDGDFERLLAVLDPDVVPSPMEVRHDRSWWRSRAALEPSPSRR